MFMFLNYMENALGTVSPFKKGKTKARLVRSNVIFNVVIKIDL